jgi:hypothetical protein
MSQVPQIMRILTLTSICLALAACSPSLATRYEIGNRALSTSEGAVYFVVMSPILLRALNTCIPPGSPYATPLLVVVADIDPLGAARKVEVEPGSRGTDCLERELAASPFPKPPLHDGESSFPIGLRVDDPGQQEQ